METQANIERLANRKQLANRKLQGDRTSVLGVAWLRLTVSFIGAAKSCGFCEHYKTIGRKVQSYFSEKLNFEKWLQPGRCQSYLGSLKLAEFERVLGW